MRDIFKQRRSVIPGLFREPLFQFIVIGVLIFVIAEFAAQWKQQQQRLIRIDQGVTQYLSNLYTAQFGVSPDGATLDRLVDNYIREEILYREALRMGLAERDEIIRRRLVQKMEFLLSGAERPVEPGIDDLTQWYESHPDSYMQEASASFRHFYFSDDAEQRADAKQRALAALDSVRSGDMQGAAVHSDPFPLEDSYHDLVSSEARRLFGQTEFVEYVFNNPEDEWQGPYRSGYGWHILYVYDRSEPRVAAFNEVSDRVTADWHEHRRMQQLESALSRLFENYDVRIAREKKR